MSDHDLHGQCRSTAVRAARPRDGHIVGGQRPGISRVDELQRHRRCRAAIARRRRGRSRIRAHGTRIDPAVVDRLVLGGRARRARNRRRSVLYVGSGRPISTRGTAAGDCHGGGSGRQSNACYASHGAMLADHDSILGTSKPLRTSCVAKWSATAAASSTKASRVAGRNADSDVCAPLSSEGSAGTVTTFAQRREK